MRSHDRKMVDAKSQTKPLTQVQAINAVREGLGLAQVNRVEEHERAAVDAIAHKQTKPSRP